METKKYPMSYSPKGIFKGDEIVPLDKEDYVKDEYGAKTVTFLGQDKRENNIRILREKQRPKVEKFIEQHGYEILERWQENEGWMDAVMNDHYTIRHPESGQVFHVHGNEDNSAVYEALGSGGSGLWGTVPATQTWYDAELAKKNEKMGSAKLEHPWYLSKHKDYKRSRHRAIPKGGKQASWG